MLGTCAWQDMIGYDMMWQAYVCMPMPVIHFPMWSGSCSGRHHGLRWATTTKEIRSTTTWHQLWYHMRVPVQQCLCIMFWANFQGPLRFVSNLLEFIFRQRFSRRSAVFWDILESQETTHAKSGNTNLMRCIGWSGRRVLCVLAFPAMHFSWLFHFHLMSTFQGNLQPNERPVRHQQHDEQWHSDVLAQKRFDNLPAPWPWTLWFPRMILTRYCNSHPSLNYHLHSFIYTCFSRMRSEGFPFIVGVWGWTCVRVAFLVSSSCRRRLVVVSSSPRRRVVVANIVNSLPLGGTFALRHHPVFSKYEKWRKSRMKCSFWRSQVTKCEVIFVFCVTGAILWQCVNASASFFRGRRSTLWCGLSRCRGRRSILWRGEGAVSTNRNGSDVQTWHYCKYRGRRRIWWLSSFWKVAEASQKSYFLSSVKMAL